MSVYGILTIIGWTVFGFYLGCVFAHGVLLFGIQNGIKLWYMNNNENQVDIIEKANSPIDQKDFQLIHQYDKNRSAFENVYRTNIVPFLEKFEKERVFYLVLCWLVYTIPFLFFSYNIVKDLPKLSILCILCMGFLLFFGVALFLFWIKKIFERRLKSKVMPFICECIENIKWKKSYTGNKSILRESAVIDKVSYNREYYDDYFYGTHKNISFEIIEAWFSRIKWYKLIPVGTFYLGYQDQLLMPIFTGIIIVLDLKKVFKGHTLVFPKKYKWRYLWNTTPEEYKLIENHFGDIEFDEQFEVYTTNETEAKSLITPTIINSLKKLEKASCTFYQDKLYIAVHTGKDSFALGTLTKKFNNSEVYYKIFDEICSIMILIDALISDGESS